MKIAAITNENLDFYRDYMQDWLMEAVQMEAAYGYSVLGDEDHRICALAFARDGLDELELLHMEILPCAEAEKAKHALIERLKQDARERDLAGIRAEDMERKDEVNGETETFFLQEGFSRDVFREDYRSVSFRELRAHAPAMGEGGSREKILPALSLSGALRGSLVALMEDESRNVSAEAAGVPVEELCLVWAKEQSVCAYLMVTEARGRYYVRDYGCLAGKEGLLEQLFCEAAERIQDLEKDAEARLYLLSGDFLFCGGGLFSALGEKGAVWEHALLDYVWDAFAETDLWESWQAIEDKRRREELAKGADAYRLYRLYRLEDMLKELELPCRFLISGDEEPCIEAEFSHYGQTYPARLFYLPEDGEMDLYTLSIEAKIGTFPEEEQDHAQDLCGDYNREKRFGCAYLSENDMYLRVTQTEAGLLTQKTVLEQIIALFGMARRELTGRL